MGKSSAVINPADMVVSKGALGSCIAYLICPSSFNLTLNQAR